jgi:hypothetical protein
VPHIVARDYDGHACPHRAKPWFERPFTGYEGCLAHRDAGHVGNCVERSRLIGADDDAKGASSYSGFIQTFLGRDAGNEVATAG